ncbi:MAG: ABC transporter ATP-binding protein [Phycisphaerales bacterium]
MSLRATDLSFAYPGSGPVLSGVTASFEPGAITALVGPNGAGKSTLLRLLAGLRSPGSGSVTLSDGSGQRAVGSIPTRERAKRLAYLAQRPEVAFAYALAQVVAFGGFVGSRDAVRESLETVGLADRADTPFAHLSAGQQQLGALARVLVQLHGVRDDGVGRYLLADEPMSAMDPAHVVQTSRIMRDLTRAGVGVVLVVHDLSLARSIADHAVVLDSAGRVGAAGPAGETLTPETLEAVFGVSFAELRGPSGVSALVPAHPSRADPPT